MNTVKAFLARPLVWAWAFVAVCVAQVIGSIVDQRWEALTISIVGLLAALLVVSAIMSRGRKTAYPDGRGNQGNREPNY